MMFHARYLLIILVTFPGNQNDIARLRKLCSRPDSLPTIDYGKSLAPLSGIETGQHVVQYIVRVFKPGIIRSEDYPIAQIYGLASHHGTLTLIPVSSGSHHRDNSTFIAQYLTNRSQYIVQRIGSVGIIHNRDIAPG